MREPFPSKTTKAGLVFGVIEQGQRLELTSQTPEYGVIFSDGIESDFLPFNSGTVATIAVADKRVRMAV